MIDGSVLQRAQKCFEKKSRVVVKMVVKANTFYTVSEVVYLNRKVHLLSKRSKFILISKACFNADASL